MLLCYTYLFCFSCKKNEGGREILEEKGSDYYVPPVDTPYLV